MSGTFVSAPESSFHGFSIPLQLYWPFTISTVLCLK